MDVWIDEFIDGTMDVYIDGCIERRIALIDGLMDQRWM